MSYARVHTEIQRARAALLEAELLRHPGDRFLAAHLAALQTVAIVLAAARQPVSAGRGRPQNPWRLLMTAAPELAEWAAFFSATEGKREAVRAGATSIVSSREADDLVRDAQAFLALVERAAQRTSVPWLPPPRRAGGVDEA